jgi:hypothetical protein
MPSSIQLYFLSAVGLNFSHVRISHIRIGKTKRIKSRWHSERIEERERFRGIKRSVPRYRPRQQTPPLAHSPVPALGTLAGTLHPAPTPTEPRPTELTPTEPSTGPSNVVNFACYGKAFGVRGKSYWIGGET